MSDTVNQLTRTCCVCKKGGSVKVKRAELDNWNGGMMAQEAFPDMSADDREQLISGTHPKCWEKLFGPEPKE